MLEKRASWTDRPEYTGKVEELINLIDWSRFLKGKLSVAQAASSASDNITSVLNGA